MSNEPRDPLQELWTHQQEETMTVDLSQLTARDDLFNSRIRWRNRRETAAGVLVLAAFGAAAVAAPIPVVQVSAALLCAGVLVVLGILHLRGAPEGPPPADVDTDAFLARYTAHLRREAKLLSWVPLWYIGPLVPGVLLLEGWVFGAAWPVVVERGAWGELAYHLGIQVAVIGGIAAAVIWLNWRMAAALEAEADALS